MFSAPDEPNANSKPLYDRKQRLRRLIEALRLPAGPDPRFVTGKVDVAHRDEFTTAVHGTWKDVQAEVIQEIVAIEGMLARPKMPPMPSEATEWLRYLCRIARRVNDAVAWIVIGQPETAIWRLRTPRIGHPNGQGLRLNRMFISQILAEGMFPEAAAAHCARMLEELAG